MPNQNNRIKVCTFSPYIRRRRSKKQALLVFRGKINENKCRVLIDSACEQIIISKEYSNSLGIKSEKIIF